MNRFEVIKREGNNLTVKVHGREAAVEIVDTFAEVYRHNETVSSVLRNIPLFLSLLFSKVSSQTQTTKNQNKCLRNKRNWWHHV